MGRELAGVVACLQEIEIACQSLAQENALNGIEKIKPIQEMLKSFFENVTLETAEQIERQLSQIGREMAGPSESRSVFSFKIEVDAHRTNLSALHIELQEVLEDLE